MNLKLFAILPILIIFITITHFLLLLFLALPRLIQQSPRSCLSIKSGVFFTNIHLVFTSKNDQQFFECRKRNDNWKRIACIYEDRKNDATYRCKGEF